MLLGVIVTLSYKENSHTDVIYSQRGASVKTPWRQGGCKNDRYVFIHAVWVSHCTVYIMWNDIWDSSADFCSSCCRLIITLCFIYCMIVYHSHINQSFWCWSLFLVAALIVLSVSDSCLKYNFKHKHQYSPSVYMSRTCYCTISWLWGIMTKHQRYFLFCVASKCFGVIFEDWIHFSFFFTLAFLWLW